MTEPLTPEEREAMRRWRLSQPWPKRGRRDLILRLLDERDALAAHADLSNQAAATAQLEAARLNYRNKELAADRDYCARKSDALAAEVERWSQRAFAADKLATERAAEVERWRNATHSATPEDLSQSVAEAVLENTRLRGEVERLAVYIVTCVYRPKDHACRQCAPESEILMVDFVCIWHQAEAIARAARERQP